MSLEYQAIRWLKYEKKCDLVLTERTPRYGHGQPDVLGITMARYLYEIEIKRSVSDFTANMKKPHIRNRTAGISLDRFPKQFWFMVPQELVEKVRSKTPEWAGLLTAENIPCQGWNTPIRVNSIKPAPVNKDSARLTLKECVKLIRNLGNEMIGLSGLRYYVRNQGSTDPHYMDGFYQQRFGPNGWEYNPDYINFQI